GAPVSIMVSCRLKPGSTIGVAMKPMPALRPNNTCVLPRSGATTSKPLRPTPPKIAAGSKLSSTFPGGPCCALATCETPSTHTMTVTTCETLDPDTDLNIGPPPFTMFHLQAHEELDLSNWEHAGRHPANHAPPFRDASRRQRRRARWLRTAPP